VLESAVANPERRLSELNLGEPADAADLLGKLNATRALYPRDLTWPRYLKLRRCVRPMAVAVICEQRQLTYQELNASADRAAGYLRERGIGPGSRVGICMSAAAELPICILAVLKTGAAYGAARPCRASCAPALNWRQPRARPRFSDGTCSRQTPLPASA